MDHHYIPKFWLKRWADPSGQVLRHRKREYDGRITSKRLSPRSFAFVEDLYKSPYVHQDMAHMLERRFFGTIDDVAAVALDEIIGARTRIPGAPLRDWVHFVMSLMFRTPTSFRELYASSARHYRAQVEAGRQEVDADVREDEPRDNHALASEDEETLTRRLHAAIHRIVINEAILDKLETLEWMVLTRTDDCPTILLSDEPVMRPVGLQQERGHIATPLTPDKLLIGVWRSPLWRIPPQHASEGGRSRAQQVDRPGGT